MSRNSGQPPWRNRRVIEGFPGNYWNQRRRAVMLAYMTDVTQILSEIEHGDPQAAEQLLPLIYEELRALAAARLFHERPGQTLQACRF